MARMSDAVIAIGHLFGAAGYAELLRELLREHEERASREPGCRLFHVGVSLSDSDHYVLTQEWDDAAAVAAFLRSATFYDFQRRLTGLLTQDMRYRVYRIRDAVALDEIAPMDPRRAD